jgi:hypothetical protein
MPFFFIVDLFRRLTIRDPSSLVATPLPSNHILPELSQRRVAAYSRLGWGGAISRTLRSALPLYAT